MVGGDREKDLVRRALDHLAGGLAPFVLDALRAVHGASWWTKGVEPGSTPIRSEEIIQRDAARWATLSDSAKIERLDHRDLLRVIEKSWFDVFAGRLRKPARSLIGECVYVANRQAHLAKGDPWTTQDAARALDTIRRLLMLCEADAKSAVVRQLLDDMAGPEVHSKLKDETGSEELAVGPSSGKTNRERTVGPTVQLPLRSAYSFVEAHGLGRDAEEIRSSRVPPKVNPSVYRRALFARLLEAKRLLAQFVSERWPHGGTEDGHRLLAGYRRLLARYSEPPGRGHQPAVDTMDFPPVEARKKSFTVFFDGEVFKPEQPVDLKPNSRYRVTFEETLDMLQSAWDALESLIGIVEGPNDLAAEHDHYLYGTDKRTGAAD